MTDQTFTTLALSLLCWEIVIKVERDEADTRRRPFVLERAGGTRIYLSSRELWQRWREEKCLASDRIVDRRSGRQFPAITLKLLLNLDDKVVHWDLFCRNVNPAN